MKFEHAQNTLKYKVGDVVVLAESVDRNYRFVPGMAVKIYQLCDFNSSDEHYIVSLVSDPSDFWYINDSEINHETTALLQMSNEGASLVQKISVENDVVSSAVNTPNNTEEKKMKFKVGDKVELVVDCYSGDGVVKGSILTVVNEHTLGDYWLTKDSVEVEMLNCSLEEFRLVQDDPKAQDNSWYENGDLPPVNTKCIFTGVDVAVEGVILAHVEHKGQYSAIIQCDGDWWTGEVGEFRPWYSDEEIAVQEREMVIEKMEFVAGGDLSIAERILMERLYDAGLRFTKEDK